jgi:hypothetical protein
MDRMSTDRFRRRVAREAARLIYTREETQFGRAKMKAARRFAAGAIEPNDLPCNGEIRYCLRALDRAGPDEQRRLLSGPHGDAADAEPSKGTVPFLPTQGSGHSPFADGTIEEEDLRRFRLYEQLLLPLERVVEPPDAHPEGDVLYHSLQVFELARQALPYDEEFLLAALLHDVGKGIDRRNHVAAGLEALAGAITPRTAWLIEHHVEAASLREGTIGARLRRRLEASENFDELTALEECDRRGRAVGMPAPDVAESLSYIRELADSSRPSLG